ncbi:MAG: MazG family protein [Defluviitaleaceae bacterium]|nr:MazG family protein [Defluviitaleaceae bacterium]
MKFDEFLDLMDILLGANGCPWDREQTHESLRQYLLEESYEAIEAIDNGDMAGLREELGDVLLQVVFHAKLAEKAEVFTINDVIAEVSHKLTSRHTHVFGGDTVANADDVLKVWEANKQKERNESPPEAMEAVPRALPALMRASKVLKHTPRPDKTEIVKDLQADLKNLAQAQDGQSEILGEMFLKLVSLSNVLKVNAELSLISAIEGLIAEHKN